MNVYIATKFDYQNKILNKVFEENKCGYKYISPQDLPEYQVKKYFEKIDIKSFEMLFNTNAFNTKELLIRIL